MPACLAGSLEDRVVEGGRRPTIADVAERAGVSKTSVSFAFNNPTRLGPGTAERIRGVAASIGYRPHPVARMLSQGRTRTIGVLTPQALAVMFENPFFGAFSAGVSEAAEQSGYAFQPISPLRGSLARAIGRATVDGIVAVGLSQHHPEVEEIRRAGLPMVTVDSTWLPNMPAVDVDEERGSREAAQHLVDLGHREFLVISIEAPVSEKEPSPDSIMSRRMHGYRDGFGDVDVVIHEVVASSATVPSGRLAFEQAWGRGLRPTAVLAMSDALAIGAMRAARDQGIRVPAELSVVGFDDIDLAEYVDPPLTTVRQPMRRKGEEAVRLLLAVLNGEQPPEIHETLATRLIVRGSTAAPRNSQSATNGRG
jgi:DNA-binding LacI/PurR family transcriptional regulator